MQPYSKEMCQSSKQEMRKSLLVILTVVFCGCEAELPDYFRSSSVLYDFTLSQYEWSGDFADYPEGDSVFYELEVAYELLPDAVNSAGDRMGILVTGNNHSDDLFMFLRKEVNDLKPNTTYEIFYIVTLASNAPTGSIGIGGSPGESVYLKAGATSQQPMKILDNGSYIMNLDKGNQATGGDDMIVLGNIANGTSSDTYKEITRSNDTTKPFSATTDSNGNLWLVVGTDSGFEGTTSIYFTKVRVYFNELD